MFALGGLRSGREGRCWRERERECEERRKRSVWRCGSRAKERRRWETREIERREGRSRKVRMWWRSSGGRDWKIVGEEVAARAIVGFYVGKNERPAV